MTEADIQKAVFQHLKERSMPGVVAWHVPNDRTSRRKSGYLAGVHDIHALHRGKFYTVELKKDGGRPSEEQLEYRDRINAAGGYSFIAEGLDEALSALECWGILRRRV